MHNTTLSVPDCHHSPTHLSFDPMTPLEDILEYLYSSYPPSQHHSNGQQQEEDQYSVAVPLIIDVSDNQNVTNNFIFEILKPSNKKMKFVGLILRNCHRLTNSGLVELLSHHPASLFPLTPFASSSLENFQLLDLSGCSAMVTDDLLQLIGNNSSFHLKTLSLRDCFRLTDVGLHWLTTTVSGGPCGGEGKGESCESLTSLDLCGCDQITDGGVASLAFHLPHLEQLHLQGCTRVTSESIALLALNCRKLKIINLQGCVRIDDVAIGQLTRNCFQLESINLQGCFRVTDASLFAIMRSCPNLKSLDIRRCSGISHAAMTTVLLKLLIHDS
jgi:hypothetical protein